MQLSTLLLQSSTSHCNIVLALLSRDLRLSRTRKIYVDANRFYAVCRDQTNQFGAVACQMCWPKTINWKRQSVSTQRSTVLIIEVLKPQCSSLMNEFLPSQLPLFCTRHPSHHSILPGKLALAQTLGRATLPCEHFSLLLQYEKNPGTRLSTAALTHLGTSHMICSWLNATLCSDWLVHTTMHVLSTRNAIIWHTLIFAPLAFYISIHEKFMSFYLSLLAVTSNWSYSNCYGRIELSNRACGHGNTLSSSWRVTFHTWHLIKTYMACTILVMHAWVWVLCSWPYNGTERIPSL